MRCKAIALDYGGYAVSFPVSQLTGVLTLSPALTGAAVPIAALQPGGWRDLQAKGYLMTAAPCSRLAREGQDGSGCLRLLPGGPTANHGVYGTLAMAGINDPVPALVSGCRAGICCHVARGYTPGLEMTCPAPAGPVRACPLGSRP